MSAAKDAAAEQAAKVAAVPMVAAAKDAAVAKASHVAEGLELEARKHAFLLINKGLDRAMPKLAAILGRAGIKDPNLLTRAVNANYRVGTADCVQRLMDCVTSSVMPQATRVDALQAFAKWAQPSGRDRVINLWRPLEPRDPALVIEKLRPELAKMLGNAPDPVCKELLQLIDVYGVGSDVGDALVGFVGDKKRSGALRTKALEMLDRLAHPEATRCAEAAAVAKASELRKAGVRILSRLNPTAAVPVLQNYFFGNWIC